MRTSSTFSILFWIYASRAVNNQTNIYIRITLNGQRVNISLKRKVDTTTWNAKTQRADRSSKVSKALNLYLNDVQSKIYRIYEQMKSDEILSTSQSIKDRFLGESRKSHSFQNLIEYHNEKMQHKLHKNTIGQYKTSQRYMLSYILEEHKKPDILLLEMDYSFVVGFENYLRSFVPKSGQLKIGHNTAMKHIKRLRRMITLAYRMEWLVRDPFDNYTIRIEKKAREFLTAHELRSIEDMTSSIERLIIVRDIFIFSCYTGISYVDIVELTDCNIVIGLDDKPWIMAERVKKGTPFKIPLLA